MSEYSGTVLNCGCDAWFTEALPLILKQLQFHLSQCGFAQGLLL